jgi:hypothetical protein
VAALRQEYGAGHHDDDKHVDVHCIRRAPPERYKLSGHCNSLREVKIMSHSTPLAVEEHVHGETVWVAVRSRGADWSWLTPAEAVRLGREWVEKYGQAVQPAE